MWKNIHGAPAVGGFEPLGPNDGQSGSYFGPEVLVLYLKRPFTAHRNDRSSLVGASDTALRLVVIYQPC